MRPLGFPLPHTWKERIDVSTTSTKRQLLDAVADAQAFRDLFAETFERWEFAGSIRRKKPEVGDVEHVVIPRTGDAPVIGSMFGEAATVNLFLHRCDELLDTGAIAKHVYAVNLASGDTTTRTMWGQKYRGISFRGHLHEVFCATPENWGSILAIRTGPADFSQRMVTALHPRGLQQMEGFVRYKRDGKMYPTRDEQAFFSACGVEYTEPEKRQ